MSGEASITFGAFETIRRISSNSGQGVVYLAKCIKPTMGIPIEARVALKVMEVSDGYGRRYASFQKRTNKLVSINHPNVVKYFGCFREEGTTDDTDNHVVVQEYLEGETLRQRLSVNPEGLDADEALRIVRETVKGLASVSELGIIHRDIKPGNIFLCKDGSVKLIDFELAGQDQTVGETPSTATAGMKGTFTYMAPEFVAPGFDGDEQSDVFSMGVVAYETLLGHLPYNGELRHEGLDARLFFTIWANNAKNPIRVSRSVRNFWRNGYEVFLSVLERDREKRCQSFALFGEWLAQIKPNYLRYVDGHGSEHAYELLRLIGSGGFGHVFKGRMPNGRFVAIKRLRHEEQYSRFRREARAMVQLNDPHFVRFVDFFSILNEKNNIRTGYLVMEYLDGMPGASLSDAIARIGHNSRKEKDGIPMRDVLLAFARYAHGLGTMHHFSGSINGEEGHVVTMKGIIHRDIKPSNLYFPPGHPERAVIMDLGIVRYVEGSVTPVGNALPGTYEYMAPELVPSPTSGGLDRGSPASDIFALGLCLYRALTGQNAYGNAIPIDPKDPRVALEALVHRASHEKPKIDKELLGRREDLRRLLVAMTEVKRENRLQDAFVVERNLLEIVRKLNVSDMPSSNHSFPWKRAIEILAVFGGGVFAVGGLWTLGTIGKNRLTQLGIRRAKRDFAHAREMIQQDIDQGRVAADKWIVVYDPSVSDIFHRIPQSFFADCTNQLDTLVKAATKPQLPKPQPPKVLPVVTNVVVSTGPSNVELSLQTERVVRAELDKFTNAVARATEFDFNTCKTYLDYARRRLSEQAKQLDSVTSNRLDVLVAQFEGWTIGLLQNETKVPLRVGTSVVKGNEAKVIVCKDRVPDTCRAEGFEPIALTRAMLDGKKVVVNADRLIAKPVKMSLPSLAEDVECLYDNRRIRGDFELRPRESRYEVIYRKGDHRDQVVTFNVEVAHPATIPAPKDWNDFRSDSLIALESAERSLVAGDLVGARRLFEKSANLVVDVNKARRAELERRIQSRQADMERQDLARRREEERAKLLAHLRQQLDFYEAGLTNWTMETRRQRIDDLWKRFQTDRPRLIPVDSNRVDLLTTRYVRERSRIRGRLQNATDQALQLRLGEKVIRYAPQEGLDVDCDKSTWAHALVEVQGYRDVAVPKWEDFDGKTFLVKSEDLVPLAISVTVPRLDNGVTCFVEEKRVSSQASFQLVPRSRAYSVVYRRQDYETQTNSFQVIPASPCKIPPPQEWRPQGALKSLFEAEASLAQDDLKRVRQLLENIGGLEDYAHRARKNKLKEEVERRERRIEGLAQLEKCEKLLSQWELETRRANVNLAGRILQERESSLKMFNAEKFAELYNRYESESQRILGYIQNGTMKKRVLLTIRLGGTTKICEPGTRQRIDCRFEDLQSAELSVKGYRKIDLPGRDAIDGKIFVIDDTMLHPAPVEVVVPKLNAGVSCAVENKLLASGGKIELEPREREYEVVYGREDHKEQRRTFKVEAGRPVSLSGPADTWQPSVALVALNEVETLYESNRFDEAAQQLKRAAAVVSVVNRARYAELKRKLEGGEKVRKILEAIVNCPDIRDVPFVLNKYLEARELGYSLSTSECETLRNRMKEYREYVNERIKKLDSRKNGTPALERRWTKDRDDAQKNFDKLMQ